MNGEHQNALRVCRGTSCFLAGSEALERRLGEVTACRGVYCLGFCDHSPVVLRPDGHTVTRCDERPTDEILGSEPPPLPPPRVRCLAPQPIVTRRLLEGDASNLTIARQLGAYEALEKALAEPPAALIETLSIAETLSEAGWRGAGRWNWAASSRPRCVVANGAAGAPGSYIDRVLLEGDPHALIEGLLLAAYAVGAEKGALLARSGHPRALEVLGAAVRAAAEAGIVGSSVMGSEFACELEIVAVPGSRVCAEDPALSRVLDSCRTAPRDSSLAPAPDSATGATLVHDVESLATVPWIRLHGAAAYRAFGTDSSPGTKVLCLDSGFALPGIYEVEFGTPLAAVLEAADGAAAEAGLMAVILGGPTGSLVFPEQWDVPLCRAALRERGLEMGHGGLVAVERGTDPLRLLIHGLELLRYESCADCTPCREGTAEAIEVVRQSLLSELGDADRGKLASLLERIAKTSPCAFGRRLPRLLEQLLERFETPV